MHECRACMHTQTRRVVHMQCRRGGSTPSFLSWRLSEFSHGRDTAGGKVSQKKMCVFMCVGGSKTQQKYMDRYNNIIVNTSLLSNTNTLCKGTLSSSFLPVHQVIPYHQVRSEDLCLDIKLVTSIFKSQLGLV